MTRLHPDRDGPVLQHAYTRAVARSHGRVFVISLTTHTSYGHIFNREVTGLAEVEAVDCNALQKFDEMLELLKQPVIHKSDQDRMCGVPLTSYTQMSQGLGC